MKTLMPMLKSHRHLVLQLLKFVISFADFSLQAAGFALGEQLEMLFGLGLAQFRVAQRLWVDN